MKTPIAVAVLASLAIGGALGYSLNTEPPPACVRALEASDKLMGYSAEAIGYATNGIGGSINDLHAVKYNMDVVRPKIESTMTTYNSNKEHCK